jgi:hypothetical protein
MFTRMGDSLNFLHIQAVLVIVAYKMNEIKPLYCYF